MSKTAVRIFALIATLGILGYLVVAKSGIFSKQKEESSPTSYSEPASLPVKAIRAQSSNLAEVLNITGTIYPDEEIMLTSEVNGMVKAIQFNEGSFVSKGKTLLKVDDSELQASLTKVNFQIELARQQKDRKEKLLKIGGISQEEYDRALTQFNTLDAEAKLLEVQIAKTEIKAPFSGTIGLRKISAGSYITPGTPIASLVKIRPVKIDFSVPEKYGTRIQNGQKVTFQLEGLTDLFEGVVYARNTSIDMETRTLLVRARSSNRSGKLIPGAFANLKLELGEFKNAIMVPTEAIIPEQGGQKVYIYRHGIAQAQGIETGIRQADRIQIISGVNAGDTIITTGLLQIFPGSQVELSEIN